MYRKHLPTQHYPSSSFQLLTWWELFQTSLRYKDVIDFKHWDPLPKNSSCLTGSLNDETLTSPLFHVLLTKLLFIQKTHSMSQWALLFCWCALCLYCWNCKKEVLLLIHKNNAYAWYDTNTTHSYHLLKRRIYFVWIHKCT